MVLYGLLIFIGIVIAIGVACCIRINHDPAYDNKLTEGEIEELERLGVEFVQKES